MFKTNIIIFSAFLFPSCFCWWIERQKMMQSAVHQHCCVSAFDHIIRFKIISLPPFINTSNVSILSSIKVFSSVFKNFQLLRLRLLFFIDLKSQHTKSMEKTMKYKCLFSKLKWINIHYHKMIKETRNRISTITLWITYLFIVYETETVSSVHYSFFTDFHSDALFKYFWISCSSSL